MVEIVIIDDEKHFLSTVKQLLSMRDDTTVVAEGRSVSEGREILKKYSPDLVLLDIEMEDGTGFNLLDTVDQIDFNVVFVTAYNQYALRAFKYSAMDYLLKPIVSSDLFEVIDKCASQKESIHLRLDAFKKNKKSINKLILSDVENVYMVEIDTIIRCEAANNYTIFHLSDDTQLVISKPLKYYADILPSEMFFRVHKSHLVNLNHMVRYQRGEGGSIVLKNNHKVPVSTRKREGLLHLLKKM